MITYNIITVNLDGINRQFVNVDYFLSTEPDDIYTALVSLNGEQWQLEEESQFPEWFHFDQQNVVFSCADLDELVNLLLVDGEFAEMTLIAIDQSHDETLVTVQDLTQ